MLKNAIMVVMLSTIGVVAATDAEQKATAQKKKPDLPYKALSAESANAPHILFVNVDHAISEQQLDRAVGMINALYGYNLWTNSIDKSMMSDVILKSGCVAERFGDNAVLAVFIERKPGGYNYLQAAGWWSMVNVSILDGDAPDAELLQERIAKVCLRGLAMCCGVCANHDSRCVMYVDGFDLKGMDAVSYTLSPFAYQPIQQALKKFGSKAPFKQWN